MQTLSFLSSDGLTYLVKRRSGYIWREVVGARPGQPNTHGFEIIANVLAYKSVNG